MRIETKFNIDDKVYHLGKDKYHVRICESLVSCIDVRVPSSSGGTPTIKYFLYGENDSFREELLFASVQELLDYISREENIICEDPKKVIWE